MRRVLPFLLLLWTAAALAQAPAASSPEDELKAAEQKLVDAERDGDTGTMQRMLSDDFVATGATGVRTGKADFIDWYHPKHYEYMTAEELDIRVYGSTAVVLGSCRQRNLNADAEEATAFTDVWVKRGGQWVIVAEHFSLLTQPQ